MQKERRYVVTSYVHHDQSPNSQYDRRLGVADSRVGAIRLMESRLNGQSLDPSMKPSIGQFLDGMRGGIVVHGPKHILAWIEPVDEE